MIFMGAVAFVLGMAIHNEAIAQHEPPKPRANLLLRYGRRAAGLRAVPRPQGSEGYLMIASNQIFLVMDEGRPVTAFTSKRELAGFLRSRF